MTALLWKMYLGTDSISFAGFSKYFLCVWTAAKHLTKCCWVASNLGELPQRVKRTRGEVRSWNSFRLFLLLGRSLLSGGEKKKSFWKLADTDLAHFHLFLWWWRTVFPCPWGCLSSPTSSRESLPNSSSCDWGIWVSRFLQVGRIKLD